MISQENRLYRVKNPRFISAAFPIVYAELSLSTRKSAKLSSHSNTNLPLFRLTYENFILDINILIIELNSSLLLKVGDASNMSNDTKTILFLNCFLQCFYSSLIVLHFT
jgi:hypothetical protein